MLEYKTLMPHLPEALAFRGHTGDGDQAVLLLHQPAKPTK